MESMPQPGTVVRLKSGGPPMTVGHPANTILESGEGGKSEREVWCEWFEGANRTSEKFDFALLEVINPPEFEDADEARAYLEEIRWKGEPACPHCGSAKAYKITPKKGSKTRKGLYKCGGCRKQYTVTVGTIFHRSKVPLNKWLLAAYLLASSREGFSAYQLQQSIDVTYQTAWFMMRRLHKSMKQDSFRAPR